MIYNLKNHYIIGSNVKHSNVGTQTSSPPFQLIWEIDITVYSTVNYVRSDVFRFIYGLGLMSLGLMVNSYLWQLLITHKKSVWYFS
jgi:hypothetical protein